MTSQPPITPDSDVLVLRELDIPGRTGPLPSGEWGINIAAVRDNFPHQGLQCRAGPWANMEVLDKLMIYWGAGNQVLQETIDPEEKGKVLTLFIPAKNIDDGFFVVSYSVRRLGQTPEPSEPMKVFVKLTRPGGKDQNGDTPGHSELHMTIPQEILDGGIDKGNVADGVPITIEPYPFMAVGDVIQVTWGGQFVLSEPLTQRQVDKLDPIGVHIDEATIREAEDSDSSGLAVAFEVYDVVDNRSEDWCAEQRVVVGVDQTRLTAPLLEEALNNVLDVTSWATRMRPCRSWLWTTTSSWAISSSSGSGAPRWRAHRSTGSLRDIDWIICRVLPRSRCPTRRSGNWSRPRWCFLIG